MIVSDRKVRLEEIYDEYSHLILGYALRRVDERQDAADIVSATFLVVWRRLDDVPSGDEARPWLYAVARRVLANHRRGENRRVRLAARLRAEVAVVATQVRAPADPTVGAAVGQAFASLADRDREILALVGWEGLDTSESAVVLGCSPGTARVRLHRARRRFAAQLTARGVESPQHSPASGHHLTDRATRPASPITRPGETTAEEHRPQHHQTCSEETVT